MTHICVSKSTVIASDNDLSPDRRQAIIWTNAGILQIGLLRTNFSEILMEIQTFSFRKMHLKRSSAKWRPSCLGLNVLSDSIFPAFHQNLSWTNTGPQSWWRHQMETFSALLALCAGNSPVPVNSPHKGQWRGVLMFSLIYAWINDWVNNREAGDLRRQRGHYDVIVMATNKLQLNLNHN